MTDDFWTSALHRSYLEGRTDGFDECVRAVVGPLRAEHESALTIAQLEAKIETLEAVSTDAFMPLDEYQLGRVRAWVTELRAQLKDLKP